MGAVGTHTLIQKITVGSAGTASVTFSSIPATYTDLKIMWSARSARVANTDDMVIGFNGVNTNLTGRYLWGTGTAAASGTDTQVLVGEYPTANSTASTFSNCEVIIPNYTSANYKSFSADTVGENNATLAYAALVAGLWSSSAAITSITLKTGSASNLVQFSTFSLYGITTSSVPASPTPQAQGGDIIVNDGTYWYHAFISTGAFVPKRSLTADVLVVAGGGGGANGGGGAGGLVYTASQSFANGTSYTTTVGAGGVSGTNGSNSNVTGGSISLTAAVGGGFGASSNTQGNGGSGGGSMGNLTSPYGRLNGGTATSGQGYAGGSGNWGGPYNGGGGGGSSAVGQDSPGNGGAGGDGVTTYSSWASATGTGVSGRYAAGGGGAANLAGSTGYSGGAGGAGGGGTGVNSGAGTAGTVNTGSGGGGSVSGYASGGSGIIIIRYKI